jgi:hypothetical protein
MQFNIISYFLKTVREKNKLVSLPLQSCPLQVQICT